MQRSAHHDELHTVTNRDEHEWDGDFSASPLHLAQPVYSKYEQILDEVPDIGHELGHEPDGVSAKPLLHDPPSCHPSHLQPNTHHNAHTHLTKRADRRLNIDVRASPPGDASQLSPLSSPLPMANHPTIHQRPSHTRYPSPSPRSGRDHVAQASPGLIFDLELGSPHPSSESADVASELRPVTVSNGIGDSFAPTLTIALRDRSVSNSTNLTSTTVASARSSTTSMSGWGETVTPGASPPASGMVGPTPSPYFSPGQQHHQQRPYTYAHTAVPESQPGRDSFGVPSGGPANGGQRTRSCGLPVAIKTALADEDDAATMTSGVYAQQRPPHMLTTSSDTIMYRTLIRTSHARRGSQPLLGQLSHDGMTRQQMNEAYGATANASATCQQLIHAALPLSHDAQQQAQSSHSSLVSSQHYNCSATVCSEPPSTRGVVVRHSPPSLYGVANVAAPESDVSGGPTATASALLGLYGAPLAHRQNFLTPGPPVRPRLGRATLDPLEASAYREGAQQTGKPRSLFQAHTRAMTEDGLDFLRRPRIQTVDSEKVQQYVLDEPSDVYGIYTQKSNHDPSFSIQSTVAGTPPDCLSNGDEVGFDLPSPVTSSASHRTKRSSMRHEPKQQPSQDENEQETLFHMDL